MPIFFHYAHKNTLIPPPYLPLYVSPNHQAFYQTRLKAYGLLWQLGEKLPQQLKKDFQQLFLHIKKDEQGRPQFPHPQIDFNLSHSGDYVAAVLAYNEKDKPKVAIDLEYSLKKRDYATLLKRFASQEEKIWVGEKKRQILSTLVCARGITQSNRNGVATITPSSMRSH